MKALLMYEDRDFDMDQEPPPQASAVMQDLELNTLFQAMSEKDSFLFNIARAALFAGMRNDVSTIHYRQEILKDCLKNPELVRELYSIAVEAIEEKKNYFISVFRNYPAGTLYDAIHALQFFADMLAKLRRWADHHANQFVSRGFGNLFTTLQREFSDEYFATIQSHLRTLKFRNGILISAALGKGNEASDIVLRQPKGPAPNWFQRLLGKGPPGYTFRLADRDEAGARIFGELRDRGINLVANALAQSTEHILSFFQLLRAELGFYVGCLNLRDRLIAKGTSIAFPEPHPQGSRKLDFRGLRDPGLILTMEQQVIANDLNADSKTLVVITGANQGGKSSFLRSIGVAQVMMQAGQFVAADSYSAEICSAIFTHYKREEDATMTSGKLDEELHRVSAIVDAVVPGSMLLFNESFASTDEREGSEIAMQIISALIEDGMKVVFVTHLYEFARRMFEMKNQEVLFLRAERNEDGTRTFKLVEAKPLETSYGEDLYNEVFAEGVQSGA